MKLRNESIIVAHAIEDDILILKHIRNILLKITEHEFIDEYELKEYDDILKDLESELKIVKIKDL